jgi:hypothetical protein
LQRSWVEEPSWGFITKVGQPDGLWDLA